MDEEEIDLDDEHGGDDGDGNPEEEGMYVLG